MKETASRMPSPTRMWSPTNQSVAQAGVGACSEWKAGEARYAPSNTLPEMAALRVSTTEMRLLARKPERKTRKTKIQLVKRVRVSGLVRRRAAVVRRKRYLYAQEGH